MPESQQDKSITTELMPNGYWHAWREVDVDPEGYPKGVGRTREDAIDDLMGELGEDVAEEVTLREALEPSRCRGCGALASVRCKCGQERGE